MIRVRDLDETLDFFCSKLGMVEVRRYDSEAGRFTLVFLAASGDTCEGTDTKADSAADIRIPVLELTYNWPSESGELETYTGGRNFGHLAYSVENIYETCQSLLESGVVIHRPPRDGYMAFIKSPDGISIELLQKGERLSPQEPWLSMENTGTW